jgi:hypothetical protein
MNVYFKFLGNIIAIMFSRGTGNRHCININFIDSIRKKCH